MFVISGPRLTFFVCCGTALVALLCAPASAEESRYVKWQQGRPFTIGAMYYDGPYGPAAALPALGGIDRHRGGDETDDADQHQEQRQGDVSLHG